MFCFVFQVNEAMIAGLLRRPGSMVHFEEAEKVLKAAGNYAELIILYEERDMQEKGIYN